MELFTTKNGVVYHTYMYNGERVVLFADGDDAKRKNLNIIDTDAFYHAAVSFEEVKNLPIESYKDCLWWPQGSGDGDDCEIIIAPVTAEDAATDEKFDLFCSVGHYEFEVAWDKGEIV